MLKLANETDDPDFATYCWSQSLPQLRIIEVKDLSFINCPDCYRVGLNPRRGKFRCREHRTDKYVPVGVRKRTKELLFTWRTRTGLVPNLFCYPHGPLTLSEFEPQGRDWWTRLGGKPPPKGVNLGPAGWRTNTSIPEDVTLPWDMCPQVYSFLETRDLIPTKTPVKKWLPALVDGGLEKSGAHERKFVEALASKLGYYIALVFIAEAWMEYQARKKFVHEAVEHARDHRKTGGQLARKADLHPVTAWRRKRKGR